MNSPAQLEISDHAMDTAALWPPNANDHKFHLAIDLSAPQQAIEGPEQQRNVLVAAVLRNTEQEWLTLPVRDRRLYGTERLRLDAVVDAGGFSLGGRRIPP